MKFDEMVMLVMQLNGHRCIVFLFLNLTCIRVLEPMQLNTRGNFCCNGDERISCGGSFSDCFRTICNKCTVPEVSSSVQKVTEKVIVELDFWRTRH